MELRRLRYFVAVAEEQSFNRAARRLHMAQPPLSVQIKNLEEELGVLLFERTSRGVLLTEAGELLLEEARRLLVQVDQTVSLVRRVGHGEVGRLTLGFVPLLRERFDLVMDRRDYFDTPIQALLRFTRSDAFLARAMRMGGYEVDECGSVAFSF